MNLLTGVVTLKYCCIVHACRMHILL